jgi:hypothetical protein
VTCVWCSTQSATSHFCDCNFRAADLFQDLRSSPTTILEPPCALYPYGAYADSSYYSLRRPLDCSLIHHLKDTHSKLSPCPAPLSLLTSGSFASPGTFAFQFLAIYPCGVVSSFSAPSCSPWFSPHKKPCSTRPSSGCDLQGIFFTRPVLFLSVSLYTFPLFNIIP